MHKQTRTLAVAVLSCPVLSGSVRDDVPTPNAAKTTSPLFRAKGVKKAAREPPTTTGSRTPKKKKTTLHYK
jgi:hypothetical protein